MEKVLIYKFWMGNKEKRNILEKQINEYNKKSKYFSIILGPTIDEHDYLMKNNSLYSKYFELRDYGLLNDIYRFWIGSKKTNIIYMDWSVEFKEDALYNLFLECKMHNKNCFIFESYRIIWPGFFISINATNLFHKCYVSVSNEDFLNSSLTITDYLKKDKKIKTFKIHDNRFAYFYDINFLNFNSNDFDVIKINPIDSQRKKDTYDAWNKKVKFFKWTNLRDLIFLSMPHFIKKIVFNLSN